MINCLLLLYSEPSAILFVIEITALFIWSLKPNSFSNDLLLSNSKIILVGDPRQVIYLTHHERKYSKYTNGKIKDFILEECKKKEPCEIDETSLKKSHRNNAKICSFSSKLYPPPDFEISEPCLCLKCRETTSTLNGIFLVKSNEIEEFLVDHNATQLRLQETTKGVLHKYNAMNFGLSKGLTFDSVLIFPTKDMKNWLKDEKQKLEDKTRAQFYVALTRGKYSVGIVYDYSDEEKFIDGVEKFKS